MSTKSAFLNHRTEAVSGNEWSVRSVRSAVKGLDVIPFAFVPEPVQYILTGLRQALIIVLPVRVWGKCTRLGGNLILPGLDKHLGLCGRRKQQPLAWL